MHTASPWTFIYVSVTKSIFSPQDSPGCLCRLWGELMCTVPLQDVGHHVICAGRGRSWFVGCAHVARGLLPGGTRPQGRGGGSLGRIPKCSEVPDKKVVGVGRQGAVGVGGGGRPRTPKMVEHPLGSHPSLRGTLKGVRRRLWAALPLQVVGPVLCGCCGVQCLCRSWAAALVQAVACATCALPLQVAGRVLCVGCGLLHCLCRGGVICSRRSRARPELDGPSVTGLPSPRGAPSPGTSPSAPPSGLVPSGARARGTSDPTQPALPGARPRAGAGPGGQQGHAGGAHYDRQPRPCDAPVAGPEAVPRH